jgi:hypothetical protein
MNNNNKIFRNNILQIIIYIITIIIIFAVITLIYHKYFKTNQIPSNIIQQINSDKIIHLVELKKYLDDLISKNDVEKICNNINNYRYNDKSALSIFYADYPYKCICSGFNSQWNDKTAQEINELSYTDCMNEGCDFYRLIVKLSSTVYKEYNKCAGFYITKWGSIRPTPYVYYVKAIKVNNQNAFAFIGFAF